ncbi:MAG TPA: MerR family transcriptional regulator [Pyrinomonadaceae bacterium]|jgi:DNA-binding transcriptional MerR regulator|nr:MerR family transcriptional regulator [Pyrinomonadaceae bacterium]
MGYAAVSIPEKIFFKIGEVCDIVDVQAHVLRYWETEFPQLSPQKNRSGQRSYRRRDVEIALRIKELLYEDEYTIAGARKKLQIELRETSRLKIVPNEPVRPETYIQPVQTPIEPEIEEFEDLEDFETELETAEENFAESKPVMINPERRQALSELASQLLELREMLKTKKMSESNSYQRKY